MAEREGVSIFPIFFHPECAGQQSHLVPGSDDSVCRTQTGKKQTNNYIKKINACYINRCFGVMLEGGYRNLKKECRDISS